MICLFWGFIMNELLLRLSLKLNQVLLFECAFPSFAMIFEFGRYIKLNVAKYWN